MAPHPAYNPTGMKSLRFILPLLALAANLHAQNVTLSASAETVESTPAARLHFSFPPGTYLYADLAVSDSTGARLEAMEKPPPVMHNGMPSHVQPFTARYPLPADGTLHIRYQACDANVCYFPTEKNLQLESPPPAPPAPPAPPVAAAESPAPPMHWQDILATHYHAPAILLGYHPAPALRAFLEPAAAIIPAAGESLQPPPEPPLEPATGLTTFNREPALFLQRRGLPLTLLLILLGGFLLNLTPCVLPMIPINLALIGAGSSNETPRRAKIIRGLIYAAGMALAYGTLGLIVLFTGTVFGAVNASPHFNFLIALLFLGMGLAMLDLWQLDFSRFRKTATPAAARTRHSAIFAAGALVALLGGACVAPVVVAVLALASALYAEGITAALFLPFILGLGMALPWPIAAAGISFLPKPGAWMNRLKKILGLLILLLGIYYLHTAAILVRANLTIAPPDYIRTLNLDTATEADLTRLIATTAESGLPLLLDFTASWCKNCHAMERGPMREEAITGILRHIETIRIQADQPTRPLARHILGTYHIPGFPAYLLFLPRE